MLHVICIEMTRTIIIHLFTEGAVNNFDEPANQSLLLTGITIERILARTSLIVYALKNIKMAIKRT